jgi:uncharacterized protein YoxC
MTCFNPFLFFVFFKWLKKTQNTPIASFRSPLLAMTAATNAVKQETADRIADVNAKAAQAADELLAATQGIEASIESLTQVMKSADENLAREMSSLAAGANIQFDSQVIWHFNNQTTEGWTGSAGVPGVSGWLVTPGGQRHRSVHYLSWRFGCRWCGVPLHHAALS